MRKYFYVLFTLFLFGLGMGLTACTSSTSHVHTYSEKWTYDEIYHWHGATCEHTNEKSELDKHTGVWTLVREATETDEGLEKRICAVCGYEETRNLSSLAHKHTYSEEWSYDAETHFHQATCGHSNEKSNVANHTYGSWTILKEATETELGSKKRVCKVCSYEQIAEIPLLPHQHTYATEWSYDAETHYRYATCEHREEKGYVSSHTYNEKNVCTVCGFVEDGLYFVLNRNKTSYMVKGLGSETGNDIVIPSTYKGLPVTTIATNAFAGCSDITSILIPSSITEIQSKAFDACYRLVEIINDSTLNIEKGSSDYGYVGYYAKSIHTSESESDLIKGNTGFVFVREDEDTYYLVQYTGILSDIVLPETINGKLYTINDYAFYNCTTLTSVQLPENITAIGTNAFKECTLLTSIELFPALESIGDGAFENCYNLVEIFNMSSLALEAGSVQYGSVAKYAKIIHSSKEESNLFEIEGEYIFLKTNENQYYLVSYKGNDEAITLPSIGENYTIKEYAFANHKDLGSIVIPNSVERIEDNAFYGCSNLEYNTYDNGNYLGNEENPYMVFVEKTDTQISSCEIHENTRFILNNVFYGCNSLTQLSIPEGIEYISSNAFDDCTSLISVTLPISALYYLTNQSKLKEIILNGGVTLPGGIFYYNFKNLTRVELPDSLIRIGSAAFNACSNLTTVVIGNSVTSIGSSAFAYCRSLTSITIPNSVTNIGDYAFSYCSSLTSITIPNSVTNIGDYAFSGCSSLTSITIPDSVISIGKNVFSYCSNLEYNTYDNGNYLGNEENPYVVFVEKTDTQISSCEIHANTRIINAYAFSNCSSLASIIIPNSVISIGTDAFSNCSSLTNVYYEGSIEDWCNIPFLSPKSNPTFYKSHVYLRNDSEWEEVTSIEIPDTITEIGSYQFYGFNYITSITIPSSVTNIGSQAFYYCTNIKEAILPTIAISFISISSLEKLTINGGNDIKDSTFNGHSNLTNVVIGNSVTSIGENAFNGCSNLTTVVMGNSVTSIGENAFNGCSSLTSITIPNSVTSIGAYAFNGCSNLTTVVMGNSVTGIGENAFNGCSSLTSITIPNSVTSIGDYAFNGCSNLTTVVMGDSVTNIGYRTFYGCSSLTSITIPNSVTSIGDYAFNGCSSLTSITIPNSVTSIGAYAFDGCSNLTTVVMGDSVTNIGYHTFSNCSSLTSITIPNTVTSIGDYAFFECSSLASIAIPNSATSIGIYAFSYCRSLASITIPNSVTSIGAAAFDGCGSIQYNEYNKAYYLGNTENPYLFLIKVKSPSLTTCEIHNDTKFIYANAFKGCSSLASITIPNSVTSIGYQTFSGCSSLTNVYYEGTIEDWCKIKFNNSVSNPMYYASHFNLRNSNNEWEEVTSIEIPDTITKIGSYQFYGFDAITSMIISNSVTNIGYHTFNGCSNLEYNTYDNGNYLGNEGNPYMVFVKNTDTQITSCEIHANTKIICASAFSECSSLTSIIISDSVISIGTDAFSECSNLTNMYYEGSIEDWCNIEFVEASANPMIYAGHFYLRNNSEWEEVTSIEIPDTITEIGSYQFYGFNYITSIIIPNSVTSIGEKAFYECGNLTNVVMGDSVISIGDYAFSRCGSLTNVVMGNSVTSIGIYAFYFCVSLTSITIPNSVTSIGENAFSHCGSLTNVVMGNSVTSIGAAAFSYCGSLTSITIPSSVTSIGAVALYQPWTSLNIFCEATSQPSGWGSSWKSSGTDNTIYWYSETQPTKSGNYWHYVDGAVTPW